MGPVDHQSIDQVGGDPVHQEVHHKDPGGDEEDPSIEVHGLPLCRADVSRDTSWKM